MATPNPATESITSTMSPNSPADLEIRAARLADPGIDLKTKHVVACEIREMLDTVRDTESARVLPQMIPALIELLRSGEVSFKKDDVEFQFRRVLLEIIQRLPVSDAVRQQSIPLFNCLLYLIRNDNEDNGATCCKAVVELIRNYRPLTEEILAEFLVIFQDAFRNMKGLVEEVLSEDSAVLDPNVSSPSIRSFKVLAELGMVVVIFMQSQRPTVLPTIQNTMPPALDLLALESSAQKRAREDYEAMGGVWAGASPTIKNIHAYSEFISAQVKMISYLAYIMRYAPEHGDTYGEILIHASLRILQDCPAAGISIRKDLMVVFRHLMTTQYRMTLVPHMEKLLNERVLLGTSVTCNEMLRFVMHSAIADLTHHLRTELSVHTLAHIVRYYSRLLHNPTLGVPLHTAFAKAMFSIADMIMAKDTPQEAGKLFTIMFESCVERLEALTLVQQEALASAQLVKNGVSPVIDAAFIERARPVGTSGYILDKPEESLLETRQFFRTLMHGIRLSLNNLQKLDAPAPDGNFIFRLFESSVRCVSLLEPDPRTGPSDSDPVEWLGPIMGDINLHVFQEVWTRQIDFFFQCAQRRIGLLGVCQYLLARESTSPTILAVILKYLVDRLPLLGEYDDMTAAATIRLFKLAFGAVTLHAGPNEPILAIYLAKLLMDCFPLAAKASKPTNYFHLLRALFRAIGGGGGRFELLYKEVLPLLPEMLDSLNRQLLASEGQTRDMIVELCLTVPLRLTHLLPHLAYLMQPLALSLRGNSELVSQGLRTLELCIDNLTPDFLDPTLSTVLRELMEALHSHLKPLPSHHHPAHTTIRILGKLGGRNRRLLTKEPTLKYHHHSEQAKMSMSFGGTATKVEIGPVALLASRLLKKGSPTDRMPAYNYLENCLTIIVHEGIKGRNVEDVFVGSLEGVWDAIHLPEVKDEAEAFIRKLSRSVFDLEIRRSQTRQPGVRLSPSPLLSAYLDTLPCAMARDVPEQATVAQALVSAIIQDLVATTNQVNVRVQDIHPTLHQIANRFSAMCLDDSWARKSAGCNGIKIMTCTPDLGVQWITDREVDLIRALIHILKDTPLDLPRNIDDVIDVLTTVLRVSNEKLDFQVEGPSNGLNKLTHLVGIFLPETQSSNPIVRQAGRTCIELLVKLSGRPAVELIMPHRDRLLATIYTKPLRALPFPMQIGMIEAIRYLVSIEPPLVEVNEELLRLLHETLALADAEDADLLGRNNPRQGTIEIVKLRVAAIKLLTASMPLTDFFLKQHQTRQKVTSVYFKSLYSESPEVKNVAHEGLRMVLTHQTRLPKELLQTGLRPILMNLADPKRLSVPGLEGLARLLELLTNYFKVEIGHKLLDHFRIVADASMLQAAARLPMSENEGITKLVRLANIFHLLPSAANIFLENLINAIVQTEAQLQFSHKSPFSEPLAKYLNRYPSEGVDFFVRHLKFQRHLQTLRSIVQAKLAPNFERELSGKTPYIISQFIQSSDPALSMPALLLFNDLATARPTWIADNEYVINALLNMWYSGFAQPEQATTALDPMEFTQRYSLILSIFIKALKQSPRIDLLFDIAVLYTRNSTMDFTRTTQFLYNHVALSSDLVYQRNVLMRFLTWFPDTSHTWAHKAYFIRYVVTPTLLVHAARPTPNHALLDLDFVGTLHRLIWHPIGDSTFARTDDMFKIELLHLTTVIVHHYADLLEDLKKDIIRCAWSYITSSDDTIVKQTAYLLTARFFAVFQTPQKFILRAWTGLLRQPHAEGKASIRQEALAALAPSLPGSDPREPGYPQWAKTTRRLVGEEGISQLIGIYQLIVKQPQLFFPVRALFVPHMVNSLNKLGLSSAATSESRLLTIEVLQVIFTWEQQATQSAVGSTDPPKSEWRTPIGFRENMVSYLVRLATSQQDPTTRNISVPRALTLLQLMVGPNGWSDVTVGLRFFSRALETTEFTNEATLSHALAHAKALQVIAMDQTDAWYTANATTLSSLVRKGLLSEDIPLQDALHPIFERLLRLFPLPKEEEEPMTLLHDFHTFVRASIVDGLHNSVALRGTLIMLKSVVQVVPERIDPHGSQLVKLFSKLAKDHIQSSPTSPAFEAGVRSQLLLLDICKFAVGFLGENRRWLFSTLTVLIEKSKSPQLLRYILDLCREWAFKQDPYPTMKEKGNLFQKLVALERGEQLFHLYLEMIYDIYTEPTLRRTEMTARLEQSFLLGCRARDPILRERFVDLLDVSIPRALSSRLIYILGVQSWEALADSNWICLALHLLLGAADVDAPVLSDRRLALLSSTGIAGIRPQAKGIIRPMQHLLFLDPQTAHDAWVSVFPATWSCLSKREQADVTQHMISLLSKDYHIRQAEVRPNVIQTLLAGIHACSPPMILPPHLVKYLAKAYGAWHVALELLESSLNYVRDDEVTVRDYVYDSLADVYAELAEEDMFYGLWRRRCLHEETNAALAFEQNGMWEQSAISYEQAQNKARAGIIALSEPEYCLWEDHWILSAEKLQQWDLLYDLAKNEGNQELMLESAWRVKDWAENKDALEEQINLLPEVPTPRRRVFEAFIALLKLPGALEKNVEFTRILEDAMQLSLRKWVGLPKNLSAAHIPLLQHFQQFVELQEAVQIFGSLSATNAQNLEKKSSELKMVLQAWRERLPNLHDDISIWSDLVAWRQNVFNAINKAYIPLINPQSQGAAATANSANTFGFRGYHETAWIINRFAHVARKHDLLEACFTSLNKIYTLPNIEISEAFLKLREQARCHYQKPNDLQAGLEVINNTNLMYFATNQKAEFYTLKGMFHARSGRNEDANQAFGQAVQLDMNQPKAWAEWGRYNDRMFKENPNEMSYAANAISCYLQAAGLYKSGKSRTLLTRVLWLLSVDDGTFTISRAFDTYKGDAAFWYWIALIPQLCLSISHREVKQARYMLLNLAKLFPQALFFTLRTTREEMVLIKKAAAAAAARQSQAAQQAGLAPAVVDAVKRQDPDHQMDDATGGANNAGSIPSQTHAVNPQPTVDGNDQQRPSAQNVPSNTVEIAPTYPVRQAWEYVDEIVQILKTAFPFLTLSMETMVDQILMKFKPTPEEDIYRHICMLLQDAMQTYVLRMNMPDDDGKLAPNTVTHLVRMAQSMSGQARKEYEEDFLRKTINHYEYIQRLQEWRDRYEKLIDSRPRIQPLDTLSHYLTEFQYGKVDEIEVPGQYTEDKDSNQNFVRIQKFSPKFENCRTHGTSWKRFVLHGNDNSRTSFSVQLPSQRHCRREERVMQIFRTFNNALNRKKESRKRNLHFHLPAAISCSPNLRLFQTDSSYVTFGDIYDQHCEASGVTKEDAILVAGEKVKKVLRTFNAHARTPEKAEFLALKKEIFDEVTAKMIPDDVITRYMIRTMEGPSELWRIRKQFGLQIASCSFMTYVLCIGGRHPSRFLMSRATGEITMTESLPSLSNQAPVFATPDVVPFRLTPNMQQFLGPITTEGILTSGIMAIARCLTEPEFDLEQQLCLFARDEVTSWMFGRQKPWAVDLAFRQNVAANIDGVVKRAETMACRIERDQALNNPGHLSTVPVIQTVTNLISSATNPIQLTKMGEMYHPWF